MPSATPTDAELLRAFCAGDAGAFAQLYDRHDRHSFDFIRRCLHPTDHGTVEDVHQEVWLAVSRAAAQFDETKARFVTWLFTIARNRVVDLQRARGGQVLDELDAADAIPDTPHHGPLARAQAHQLAQAVTAAVETLPLAQRETFVLFSFEEMTLQEIAEVTQVPVETAKTRLRYARDALRNALSVWRTADV